MFNSYSITVYLFGVFWKDLLKLSRLNLSLLASSFWGYSTFCYFFYYFFAYSFSSFFPSFFVSFLGYFDFIYLAFYIFYTFCPSCFFSITPKLTLNRVSHKNILPEVCKKGSKFLTKVYHLVKFTNFFLISPLITSRNAVSSWQHKVMSAKVKLLPTIYDFNLNLSSITFKTFFSSSQA